MHYVVTHNVIDINQHDFVPKKSTCTQLLDIQHDWCAGLDNRNIFDVITIDFHNAFDVVPQTKLVYKLGGLRVFSDTKLA